MKKIVAVLTAICTLALAGCAKPDDNDMTVAVATVNGEEILRSEFAELYDAYAYYYSQYYSQSDYPDYYAELKINILNSLVSQKVIEQKAKEAGYYNFTQEQIDAKTKEIEADIEQQINDSAANLQKIDSRSDEHDYQYYYDLAKEKVYEDMRLNGETVESRVQYELEEEAYLAFEKECVKDAEATDEEISKKYTELMREQKESYLGDEDGNNYSAFYSDLTAGGDIMVYYLDGYRRVQHILLSYADEDLEAVEEAADDLYTAKTALTAAETTLKTLNTEFEALTDDEEKQAKQTEIEEAEQKRKQAQDDVDNAQKAYDTARSTAESNSHAAADELYNSVKDADEAAFIAVMLEKTGDTGMNTEAAAKEGYIIGNGDGMVDEFHDASLALEKVGDISLPVASDYGYHIIRLVKILPQGEVPLEDVKAEIKAELDAQKKETQWEALVDEWESNSKITKDTKWVTQYTFG